VMAAATGSAPTLIGVEPVWGARVEQADRAVVGAADERSVRPARGVIEVGYEYVPTERAARHGRWR
jgi:hypothetical protein